MTRQQQQLLKEEEIKTILEFWQQKLNYHKRILDALSSLEHPDTRQKEAIEYHALAFTFCNIHHQRTQHASNH